MGNNDNFFEMCRESFQDVKDAWDDVVIAFKELGDILESEITNETPKQKKSLNDEKIFAETQEQNEFTLNENSSWDDIINEIKSMQELLHNTLDVMEKNEQKANIAIKVLKDLISQVKENPEFMQNIPFETIDAFRQNLKDFKETEKTVQFQLK